jgi:MFS family permease
LGQISSVSAQTMEFVAMAWLILDLTGSPFLLGITSMAHAVPSLAFFLFAGAAADRTDRRKLLMAIFAGASAIYFAIGVLVLTHTVQVWHVLLASLLIGCLRVMDQPARHGMIPNTVPREDMPYAIAMSSFAFQVPRPIAPAVAGVLIALIGIGATYLVIAAGALMAMTMYSLLRVDAKPRGGEEHGWIQDVMEGVRFVRSDQVIYGLMGLSFVNSLFGLSYIVLLPVLAREVLDVGPEGYGLMHTLTGIGGMLGALAAAQLARNGHQGRQAILGAIAFGFLLVSLAYIPWYVVACTLLFFIGVFNQLYMTTTTTVLQLSIPNDLRGRVMSIWGITFSLIPTGGAISGAVTEHMGVQFALAMGGCFVIASTLIAAASLPRLREIDRGTAPAPAAG